ncbi:MAG: ABC transporter ATP-binding protein/permease, partial [Oscillospiraceae bacterium]|nr:ABC transporter ATP-binding protein/permease [Oscillospiraceae bacterium]
MLGSIKKSEKPKYGTLSSVVFLVGTAWRRQRSVLAWCAALATLGVASSLLALLVAPMIIGALEEGRPLGPLIAAIASMAAGLTLSAALTAYAEKNAPFGRVAIRSHLVARLHAKFMTTSYINTESQDMLYKLDRARMSLVSGENSSEAVWASLTNLLKSVMGFAAYLFLLSSLDLWVALLVLATCAAGFAANRPISRWGYAHRAEEAEYSRKMGYVYSQAEDTSLAKDVRLFGIKGWLDDMYASCLRLYQSFAARGQRVYIWQDVIDLALAFLRNGAAYAYLIGRVLGDGMSASEFLLAFTAVGGFTAWVSGILSGFATLYTQSLEISTLREVLDYYEPFAFEAGERLDPVPGKPYTIELRGVSFRYPGSDSDVLEGLDLTVGAGERLAVVGANGAGKTTL